MKLYSYCSDDFVDVAKNVLMPSAARAGFDCTVYGIGELKTSCDDKNGEWLRLNRTKVEIVLTAIDAEDKPFVFADADVRFYGDASRDMLRCLGAADIAFQCDWWGRAVPCLGLFICRPNERTRKLFKDILERLTEDNSDQEVTHEILKGPYDLNWMLLPSRYWTHGAHMGVRWDGETVLNPPQDIMAHHANWVVGKEMKMRLLDHVNGRVLDL